MLDKVLKILWLVNGVLLLAILLFAGYRLVLEEFILYGGPDSESGVVIGGEQADALKTGAEFQGLVYDPIVPVPGTIFRVLPVSAKRFKSTMQDIEQYSDLSHHVSLEDVGLSTYGNVNLIFLDLDYRVVNKLLDKRGFIRATASPKIMSDDQDAIDPTVKNIVYLISFADSNNDGILNEYDIADLYISGEDGSNLTKVTDNMDVVDFQFINNNSEILISYEERGGLDSHYMSRRYAKYQITRETLLELSTLHQAISETEKLLMVDTTSTLP